MTAQPSRRLNHNRVKVCNRESKRLDLHDGSFTDEFLQKEASILPGACLCGRVTEGNQPKADWEISISDKTLPPPENRRRGCAEGTSLQRLALTPALSQREREFC